MRSGDRKRRKERNGPKAGAINLFYIRKPGRSENKNSAAGGEERKKSSREIKRRGSAGQKDRWTDGDRDRETRTEGRRNGAQTVGVVWTRTKHVRWMMGPQRFCACRLYTHTPLRYYSINYKYIYIHTNKHIHAKRVLLLLLLPLLRYTTVQYQLYHYYHYNDTATSPPRSANVYLTPGSVPVRPYSL